MRAILPAMSMLLSCHPGPAGSPGRAPRIAVRLPHGPTTDGRLLVIFSRAAEGEPRQQVTDDDSTAQVFGVDVTRWNQGELRHLEGDVAGYPLPSLASLPAGEYTVQAVLHKYETFHRADGHVVLLPADRGEGQQWKEAPGNLHSAPRRVRFDPAATDTIDLELDQIIMPLPALPESRYRKHIVFESPSLSKFWGRPVQLGALLLLPEGWYDHPKARYPLAIYHSHFGRDLTGWRETPPDEGLPPIDLETLRRVCPNGHGPGCAAAGYERMQQEAAYRFYQTWTGPGFPRVLLLQIQHANPYYDDSYAVNSQNLGPYGDAITHELIPYLEREYRGLGPWARGMYGGSTGGWEALAAQVLYPDEYNGAIASCPDPVDFRAYITMDIYQDANAFYAEGPFRRTPRAGSRLADGTIRSLLEQDNRYELALGTRSRSGLQFDIWEAVYSPVGEDGYPQRIFDKTTGVIDRRVAEHWRDNYDLGHILTRDWARLGPKLRGKIRVNVGNLDTYYLDRAVRLLEARLRELGSDAVFAYGALDGHCWSGDPTEMNFQTRLTYHARNIPILVEGFLARAPAGADTTSWRY